MRKCTQMVASAVLGLPSEERIQNECTKNKANRAYGKRRTELPQLIENRNNCWSYQASKSGSSVVHNTD
jgi:hypothetical protein